MRRPCHATHARSPPPRSSHAWCTCKRSRLEALMRDQTAVAQYASQETSVGIHEGPLRIILHGEQRSCAATNDSIAKSFETHDAHAYSSVVRMDARTDPTIFASPMSRCARGAQRKTANKPNNIRNLWSERDHISRRQHGTGTALPVK
eukprot:6202576-Pleurochrysis_carterae.AAC.1